MPADRRADVQQGVFETLLVIDGRPVAAAAHLARLHHSLSALYGAGAPADLSDRLAGHAASLNGRYRLRIDAVPEANRMRFDFSVSPLPAGLTTSVTLAPVLVPGGLGAHKLRDRRRLDGLAAPGLTPLLVDTNGDVLEAAWGNLWLREDDQLVTPHADGRVLPGVTRARLLAIAPRLGCAATEERVSADRLAGATAVFVTSALRLAVGATDSRWPTTPAAEQEWLAAARTALAEME